MKHASHQSRSNVQTWMFEAQAKSGCLEVWLFSKLPIDHPKVIFKTGLPRYSIGGEVWYTRLSLVSLRIWEHWENQMEMRFNIGTRQISVLFLNQWPTFIEYTRISKKLVRQQLFSWYRPAACKMLERILQITYILRNICINPVKSGAKCTIFISYHLCKSPQLQLLIFKYPNIFGNTESLFKVPFYRNTLWWCNQLTTLL